MTIENKLKNLIISEYGSLLAFSKKTGIANSTLVSIISRGVDKASINKLLAICDALHISADELLAGRIVKVIPPTDSDLEQFLKATRIGANFSLDGIPMTEAEIACVFDAMQTALNCIRRLR